MNLTYQLLALDPSEKTRCENAASLLHLIRGFTKLWKNPHISADRITDGNTTLTIVGIEEADNSSATQTDELGRAFILSLNGTYNHIESLKNMLSRVALLFWKLAKIFF
jgi:hypothetical protein